VPFQLAAVRFSEERSQPSVKVAFPLARLKKPFTSKSVVGAQAGLEIDEC